MKCGDTSTFLSKRPRANQFDDYARVGFDRSAYEVEILVHLTPLPFRGSPAAKEER